VSAQEIDQYLEALEEPKRGTLDLLRRRILDVLPDAEQGMSYGVPAFKVRGKTVAGFAAFSDHLSYLPHSGSVFPQIADELAGYTFSKGALRFDVDRTLPASLVERLVEVRVRQAFPD
jgi:uncharacterized protein YdhG (YjbR/CyaY superfamily)